MDKNEYLSMHDQKGSEMSFILHSEYNDSTKTWKTVGKAIFGISFDLVTWGHVKKEVMVYDNNLTTSVAIVMKTLSETVYEKDFEKNLIGSVNEV